MAKLSDQLVQELLQGRHVACLGTENDDGSVHLVAVWYRFDGEAIYVATASRSRKARNVKARPKASLMIDVRRGVAAYGATLSGPVEILTGDAAREANRSVHQRYLSSAAVADSRVGGVFAQWDDIALRITPQSVFAWDMREADKAVFGGAMAANPDYLLPVDL